MTNPTIDNKIYLQDVDHFKSVYRDFFAPLCLFASKFVPENEKDLVNSLFIKLWQRELSFDSHEHCRNYLYKSAYHACMDELNLQKNSKLREDGYARSMPMQDDTVEDLIVENEYWAVIFRELSNLPTPYNNVLKMSYVEGLKNQEIAQELNLSMQTVKNQKSKGLKLLRSILLKHVSLPSLILWFLG
ncbi:sigma-70 family RNA polymerase sigma factor [Sphingobacterium sp. lm-10]|uniref:sigma-70 family RNA polymerase sigma factor n=1 Tax=Sphingobacterium sp. lm-10 TaxID=2944904 RepID=UPI00201FC60F|nr:sigma-70 family RNA polymerase sigma factor [Sphingobacterium sp. lm-10]MCL7986406.1 sigma-70 family RNA polymerase sigma factor [Sphingobacterium sp. lm-10]